MPGVWVLRRLGLEEQGKGRCLGRGVRVSLDLRGSFSRVEYCRFTGRGKRLRGRSDSCMGKDIVQGRICLPSIRFHIYRNSCQIVNEHYLRTATQAIDLLQ